MKCYELRILILQSSRANIRHWEPWLSIRAKLELGPYLTPLTKVHSKWIKELNVKSEILKVMEENVGDCLCDLQIGNTLCSNVQTIEQKQEQKWVTSLTSR